MKRFAISTLKNSLHLPGQVKETPCFELIYLHRLNPILKPFFDWAENGAFWQDVYKKDDFNLLRSMVQKHEGIESVPIFEFWVNHTATETWVYRNSDGIPLAFVLRIDIQKINETEKIKDPSVEKVLDYGNRQWILRSGEIVSLFRYWIANDTYQGVSSLQSVMFLSIVQYYFTPSLAISMLACTHPQFWKQVLNYADLNQIPELDFTVNQIPFGWYFHDWRKRSPLIWLDIMGKREIEEVAQYDEASAEAVSILVLSKEEFDLSAQRAIKNYHQTDVLLNNPLLKSKLIVHELIEEIKAIDKIKVLKGFIDTVLKEIESFTGGWKVLSRPL